MPENSPRLGIPRPLGNENVTRANYRAALDAIDENAAKELDLAAHLADNVPHIPYAIASGSANTYAVTLNPAPTSYTEGMAIAVKINIDNTGASTINVNNLGAKGIKKPNGNDVSAGNLKNGSIYTLRHNGTNFIVQGEGASGDATASDLLSGKKASVDAGDITGTMPNKVGSATVLTPGTADQAVPQGYYGGAVGDGKVLGDADLVAAKIKSGVNIFGVAGTVVEATGDAVVADVLAGKVFSKAGSAGLTGTMVDRGTVNITPGTGNQSITAGKHSGAGVVYGDADLAAGNIRAGVNIFGVVGATAIMNTAGVNATAGIILTGYNACVQGAVVTGTMPFRGGVGITPGAGDQAIVAGYHDGSGLVYGDADLIASNIKSTANIFNVAGTCHGAAAGPSESALFTGHPDNHLISSLTYRQMTELGSITAQVNGAIRIKTMLHLNDSGRDAWLRIRKNGVEVGTEHYSTSGGDWVYSDDIACAIGDVFTVWARIANLSYDCSAGTFYACGSWSCYDTIATYSA